MQRDHPDSLAMLTVYGSHEIGELLKGLDLKIGVLEESYRCFSVGLAAYQE
jgi:hypothetical protein